uniref:Uncharacterized protein n=1 Tax=Ditylenchus dipsaci TaxID=166011 RepID=A0A915ED10_9BILA
MTGRVANPISIVTLCRPFGCLPAVRRPAVSNRKAKKGRKQEQETVNESNLKIEYRNKKELLNEIDYSKYFVVDEKNEINIGCPEAVIRENQMEKLEIRKGFLLDPSGKKKKTFLNSTSEKGLNETIIIYLRHYKLRTYEEMGYMPH